MIAAPAFASLLFVPGNRPDRIDKALASAADVVCVDFEDAVPADEKAATRSDVIARLAGWPAARMVVRINALTTRDGIDDLVALADAIGSGAPAPAMLMLPKTESARDAAIMRGVLGDRMPPLIALVETVRGMRAVDAIAAADGVAGVMIGIADLSAELGCDCAWEPLVSARRRMVAACALAGKVAVDGPCIDLGDPGAGADEAARSRALGFRAKAAIHPNQIDGIHAAFRPDADRVAAARAAIAAFEAAGRRAIRHNGTLLEVPIIRQLERVAAFGKETADA